MTVEINIVAALLKSAFMAAGGQDTAWLSMTRAEIKPRKLSKRARLHKISPCCFWCGRVTVLETVKPITNPLVATIDHLFSRLHPLRAVNEHLYVLACYSCNISRSIAENANRVFEPELRSRVNVAQEVCATLARRTGILPALPAPVPNPPWVISAIEQSVMLTQVEQDSGRVLSLKEEYEQKVKRRRK